MTRQHALPFEEANKVAERRVILFEIMGATDLKHPENTDRSDGMHPFVVATLHLKEQEKMFLTRTKRRKDTCNPIWCVEHRCLFLLNITDAISENDGTCAVKFDVRDKDSVISDPLTCTLIGSVELPLSKILHACDKMPEERIELQLEHALDPNNSCYQSKIESSTEVGDKNEIGETSSNDFNKPTSLLSIRVRFATPFDQQFMRELDGINDAHGLSIINSYWKKIAKAVHGKNMPKMNDKSPKQQQLITDKSQREVGVNGIMNMISGVYEWKTSKGSDGIRRERVQPYPDPSRLQETRYLSHTEMVKEMYQPSTNWTECGKETEETLGSVYLEILQCEKLPNMDAGEALGNKTDAFVCAIYEESLVQTEVIDDRLSPMWMPWTQRAFCFNMKHPFSQLFISVNDFDLGPSAHDGIGRIAVNLNHFESNVTYTLKYNLHPAANVVARESLGTVTIRFRKHVENEKALLMSALQATPRHHVNMKSHRTLPVANFTCYGNHDEDCYDVQLLRSYVNEMIELKRLLVYAVGDSISSLIMWRGQVKVGSKHLPLHSLLAFFGGIYVVERTHLLPGFFFLTIAWMMLASSINRQQHPSPWHRTNSFFYYLSILLSNGNSPQKQTLIRPMENHKEAAKFESNWSHRISTDQDAAWKKWELQNEMNRIGNQDLNTEESKASTDPLVLALASLKPRLFPIQLRLRGYCNILRRIKAVTSWEEGIVSFWITLVCIVIGIVLLVLPTTFLLHWACRILIWIGLGPWFRIYYELYVPKEENPMDLQNEEDRIKHQGDILDKVKVNFKEKGRLARQRGEEALKMKSMRKFRFGDFIAKVPRMYLARHHDYPLSESKAAHISLHPQHTIPPLNFETRNIIPSQHLDGKMIPLTEDQKKFAHIQDTRVAAKENVDKECGTQPLAPRSEVDSSDSGTSLSEFLSFEETSIHDAVSTQTCRRSIDEDQRSPKETMETARTMQKETNDEREQESIEIVANFEDASYSVRK